LKKIGSLSLLAVLALALVAAGCGSSSSDSTSDALTKADFIKQADAICTKGNKDITAAAAKLGNSPSEPQIEEFASSTIVPGIQDELDQIRELTPPAGDESKVNDFLDAADEATNKVKDDPSLINASANPFADANKKAVAYGLKVCGQG